MPNFTYPPIPQHDPAPAEYFAAVTASDTVPLPGGVCRALHVGVAGTVAAIDPKSGATVSFTAGNGVLPIRTGQVMATGTTATGIVALY